jgi:hypothetical protein
MYQKGAALKHYETKPVLFLTEQQIFRTIKAEYKEPGWE